MPTPRFLAGLLTATAVLATAIAVVLASPLPQPRQATAISPATNCTESAPVLNSGVYDISTPGQLLSLARSVNSTSLSASYRQTVDLDLTNCGNWPGIGGGGATAPFTGTYDGDGHTILNLSISATGASWGLFRNVDANNALVENLTLQDATVVAPNPTSNEFSYGALVGELRAGAIDNVTVVDADVLAEHSVGGLIGLVRTSSASTSVTIANTHVSASATATRTSAPANVGGVVGIVRNAVSGGVVSVSTTSAVGEVTGSGANSNSVGGLIGEVFSHYSGLLVTVSASFSRANTTGGLKVGGLIGLVDTGSSQPGHFWLRNSYALGTVDSTVNSGAGASAGGLIGEIEGTYEVKHSFGAGRVNGTGITVGGLIGKNWGSQASVVDSFWDATTTGQAGSDGGTSKTTAQIQTFSMLNTAGWSITNGAGGSTIWGICDAETYPFLNWQTDAGAPCTPGPGDPASCTAVVPVLQAGVYQIASPGNFRWIASGPDARLAARYRQTADIDLTPCGDWPGIGGGSVDPFTGSYDGGGYRITNLVSTSAVATRWGLFRNTSNATITNLTLSGVTISGSANEVGSLVGYAVSTTISAVTVTNASVSASSDVGGLVGKTAGSTRTQIEATVTGAVNGQSSVGGLVGWANGPTTIRNTTTTVRVTATSQAGGVVGYVYDDVEFDQVTSSGDVTATGAEVGGIIGFAETNVTMNGVTRTGSVRGSTDVGGLIGEADSLTLSITGGSVDSTVAATLGSGDTRVGGVLGDADSDSNVTITGLTVGGNVSTTGNKAGGFIGAAAGHVTLSAITRTGAVSGNEYVGGAVGYFAAGKNLNVSGSTIGGSITGEGSVGGVLGQSGSSATTHVIISNSTITAPVIAQGDEAGGVVGFAAGHVTISAVTRSGDVSVSATGYAAGGFVGYNNTYSLLIENSTSSSDVRGRSEVGGAIGVFTNETATLNNVVLSGTVYGNSVSNVTEVGCYVGTIDDANDAGLSKTGSRATGMKVVDGVSTPCPDYVAPGTGSTPLPPAVSELVTQPVAPPTTTPSTTVPTTRPPTTTPPSTTVPAPVPDGGVLPELEPGASQVITDGVPTNVEVFIDNTTDLVLRGQGFELRLAGDCTFGCTIQTDANGREVLTLEERGLANVSGEGFQAGTLVYIWLFSEPRFLGTLRVNADGTFTGNVPLGDIAPGLHTLQVNGTSFDGLPRTANLGVIVNPAGSPLPTPGPGTLPATGTTTTPLWLTALLLLSLGVGLVTLGRRRTSTTR